MEILIPYQQNNMDAIKQFYDDPNITPEKKKMLSDAISKWMPRADAESYISKTFYNQPEAPKEGFMSKVSKWLSDIWDGINNFVGWAVSEVPKVVWDTTWFLASASKYNPLGYVEDAIKAPFSDKTYGEIRNERAKAADTTAEWLMWAWQKWKDMLSGAHDPNSIWAKLWETATDIGSSLLMPWGVEAKWGNWLAKWAKLAVDGGIQGAKYDIASKGEVTPESVAAWAAWNTILWALWGAYKWLKGITNTPTNVIDEATQTIKTPWIIFDKWHPVEVNIPNPWKIKGMWNNVFDSTPESSAIADSKWLTERMKLANRALMPSVSWKTMGQVMSQPKETEEALKTLWTLHRTWRVDGSLDSLYEWAQAVQNGLEKYGKIIGDAIKKNGWKEVDMTDIWVDAKKIVEDPIQSYAKAHAPLKALTDAIEQGGGKTSVNDLFEIKKIFQDQLWSLIKDGQMNSNAYKALKDAVEKIWSKIDTEIAWANVADETFKNAKTIYSQLKKIQPSIIKSAQVDARQSPMSLAEQIALMQHNPIDWVTNPIDAVKWKAIKAMADEIKNRTSRDGTFQQLMRIYDREAANNYANSKNPVKSTMWEFIKKWVKRTSIPAVDSTVQK